MSERLQKLMARAGLGSRRSLETDITQGEVFLNGQLARLGDRAQVGDRIRYGQRRYRVVLSANPDFRLIAYHKPEGRVTTRSDEQNRPTVFEHLPRLKDSRWIAVGRLDINTSGLLLFTTSGDLAHKLMHPSSEIEREYACRIRGPVSEEHLKALQEGIELEDGPARFQRCWFDGGTENNQWYRVVLSEGRNREVRRMWTSLGYQVSRLIRVRYGPVELPGHVRVGKFIDVADHLVEQLQQMTGLSPAKTGSKTTGRKQAAGRRGTEQRLERPTKKSDAGDTAGGEQLKLVAEVSPRGGRTRRHSGPRSRTGAGARRRRPGRR
jgi:23S rRNA pseudouridine2605 synthase